MNRSELRALYAAVLALGLSSMWLEVLSFRLSVAVLGPGFAAALAFWLPGAMALGAALLTRIAADATVPVLARRAAHLSAIAGTTIIVGAIAFSWVSQVVAHAEGPGVLHGFVALVSWLLPAFFSGGALALALRAGLERVGRVSWLEVIGAVAGCLLLSAAFAMGAPRAALATGLPFAGAALALAYVGRSARPRWAALATVPLGVVVLLAGDIGSPWMRMRTDVGKRTNIGLYLWTPQGLIAVDNADRGRASMTIDKSGPIALAEDHQSKAKAQFAVQDLAYSVSDSKGPALVIGAQGGRELEVALEQGHDLVEAIGIQGELVNDILGDSYAKATGYVLADERVRVTVGDARAILGSLPKEQYKRVVVLGEGRPVQTGPRLLMRHDRLFTVEALRAYLERLAPGGSLLLQVPRAALPAVFATFAELHGGHNLELDSYLTVCNSRTDVASVLYYDSTDRVRTALAKRCQRNRMTVMNRPEPPKVPPKVPSAAPAAAASAETERVAEKEWLTSGRPAWDAQPFLDTADEIRWSAALAELDLAPPPSGAPKEAEPSQASLAVSAAVMLTGVLLLVALLPPPRTAQQRPFPRVLELAMAPFGLSLALSLFALIDALLVSLGDAAYGWALLVPMSLVGVATGRLFIDVVKSGWMAAVAIPAMLVGIAWLVVIAIAAPPLLDVLVGHSLVVLALSLPLLIVTGAILGAPLAAMLRILASRRPELVGSCIATHHAAWALGGALAVILAHEASMHAVLIWGVAFYVAAVALAAFGLKQLQQAA